MVLELKPPTTGDVAALAPLLPVFLSYVLSFVFLGIYWTNHHHMLHVTRRVNGTILWATLHLLFWLSLVPFATSWMGENHFAALPSAVYGVVLLASALAYTILQQAIIARQGAHSRLARAVGHDRKGRVSLVCYVIAIPLAFVHPAISGVLYVIVALMWLVPDRRIERILFDPQPGEAHGD
jgi:uncharacterized membrane protein